MPSYKPPVQDIQFLLNDVLGAHERTKDIPSCAAVDSETVEMVLQTAADYGVKQALPLNHSADEEGCKFDGASGKVTTPKAYKDLHEAYAATGMIGLTGCAQFGGSEMPHYVAAGVGEIITATNFAHAMLSGLTGGFAKVIEKYGTEEQKARLLPKLYSGEWSGTMCLTEPEGGSDLARITTQAVPNADGTYSITGNKIFISFGEQDITGNIVHLVLARLPGAPEGTKGISLFEVQKLDDKGASNHVKCINIEHKMGINGSATCSLAFEGAVGKLVGKVNEGLPAMFTMMNDARLKVGIQGLSLSEIAYQNAAEFANIRIQGKSMKEAFNKGAKATAIINHANIRRDLIDMKSQIDCYRALALETAIQLDIAEKHPDEAKRKAAEDYVSLLTPVLKSNLTDLSCRAAEKGIQIHGGMGFIRETGVEQYYRDALIGTIYEGTNDIQGMDFAFKKTLAPKKPSLKELAKGMIKKLTFSFKHAVDPRAPRLKSFVKGLESDIVLAKKNPALKAHAKTVGQSLDLFSGIAQKLGEAMMDSRQDPSKLEEVLVHSKDFMDMFGKVAAGGMWLKIVAAADAKAAADPAFKEFADKQRELADNYINRIMMPDVLRFDVRMKADIGAIRNIKPESLLP
jgi:acyl-CoA dehydrogenase